MNHSEPTTDTATSATDGVHEDDRVALADARHAGWFQWETAELFTGFVIARDDQVLDIGTGDGGYARFCARLSAHVCCVDLNAERLEATLQYVRADAIGNVEAIIAHADKLPIAAASKNRIVCTEVLEHVSDPDAALREAYRVGTDDALYLLTVPDARSEEFQKQVAHPSYFEEPNHIHIYARDQFRALVERAGLEVIEHTSYGFYQSMWLSLFWSCGLDDVRDRSHPLLKSWDRTWGLFMDTPQADTALQSLDEIMPRTQLILARKSRTAA